MPSGCGACRATPAVVVPPRSLLREHLPLLRLPDQGGAQTRPDRYLRRPARRRDRHSSAAALPSRGVTHLHWGGGTPSISAPSICPTRSRGSRRSSISPPSMSMRSNSIRDGCRRPSCAAGAQVGVNRASLGVQDFAPHVQNAIGRVQPFDLVRDAVALLRDAGIGGINMDLMYGLPQQTVADVVRSAELAASLGPQRIALFGYAHVPWFRPSPAPDRRGIAAGRGRAAGADEGGAGHAVANGYVAIGLDHFAQPSDDARVAQRAGRLHRNFQGYTDRSGRRADRHRNVLDRPAAAGIVAERAGHRRLLRARSMPAGSPSSRDSRSRPTIGCGQPSSNA